MKVIKNGLAKQYQKVKTQLVATYLAQSLGVLSMVGLGFFVSDLNSLVFKIAVSVLSVSVIVAAALESVVKNKKRKLEKVVFEDFESFNSDYVLKGTQKVLSLVSVKIIGGDLEVEMKETDKPFVRNNSGNGYSPFWGVLALGLSGLVADVFLKYSLSNFFQANIWVTALVVALFWVVLSKVFKWR